VAAVRAAARGCMRVARRAACMACALACVFPAADGKYRYRAASVYIGWPGRVTAAGGGGRKALG